MKTPFTIYFKQASIPLTQVSRAPFTPVYAMPFVAANCAEYWVGDDCQLSYRWHDGFDVFVAVLEARMVGAGGHAGLTLPVASLLHDLHLVYQLHGESAIHQTLASSSGPEVVTLPTGHHIEVYAPPSSITLRTMADHHTGRYVIVTVVPKRSWMTRYFANELNPMEELVLLLRQRYITHRYLQPRAITPAMHTWLYLLCTLPPYPDLFMDKE